ncbi:MAG: DUF192 domain-containing protein [bacterium]
MKKTFFLIFIIIFLSGCGLKYSVDEPHLIIDNKKIKIEIADDYVEIVNGLSGREYLEKESGMLFVFNDKQIRDFWMKNMRFPLDIIWINDNKIIDISKNLLPEGENPLNHYYSPKPVNYVLEVNGGFCEKNNIKTGDSVKIIYD